MVIPRSRSAPNVQLQQTKIPPGWNMISSAVVAVEVFIKNAHVPTFTQPPTSELDVNKLCDSHMWRKCRFLFIKWVLIRVRTALYCVVRMAATHNNEHSEPSSLQTFSIKFSIMHGTRGWNISFLRKGTFFLEKATSRGAHRISWFQWLEFSRHQTRAKCRSSEVKKSPIERIDFLVFCKMPSHVKILVKLGFNAM